MSGEIRRFKRYPSYKDSGVEWLGRLPAPLLAHTLTVPSQPPVDLIDPDAGSRRRARAGG